MKRSNNPHPKLAALRQAYLTMPNRGAVLLVTPDGTVHNGIVSLVQFKSRSSAYRQLRMAGFLPTSRGWFIYEKANQINSPAQRGEGRAE